MAPNAPKKEWDFATYSDEHVVESFNRDVGNRGWVAARGRFLHALLIEFAKRGIDFSCIKSGDSISLRRVRLAGKRLELEAGKEQASGGSTIFLETVP
jgi:hypothetical protein